jgi:hypothetical protein
MYVRIPGRALLGDSSAARLLLSLPLFPLSLPWTMYEGYQLLKDVQPIPGSSTRDNILNAFTGKPTQSQINQIIADCQAQNARARSYGYTVAANADQGCADAVNAYVKRFLDDTLADTSAKNIGIAALFVIAASVGGFLWLKTR